LTDYISLFCDSHHIDLSGPYGPDELSGEGQAARNFAFDYVFVDGMCTIANGSEAIQCGNPKGSREIAV
jgi:hypothetical protein